MSLTHFVNYQQHLTVAQNVQAFVDKILYTAACYQSTCGNNVLRLHLNLSLCDNIESVNDNNKHTKLILLPTAKTVVITCSYKSLTQNTAALGYNDIGLRDTSSTMSDILWHQLIHHC
jgi:hypothetical protein